MVHFRTGCQSDMVEVDKEFEYVFKPNVRRIRFAELRLCELESRRSTAQFFNNPLFLQKMVLRGGGASGEGKTVDSAVLDENRMRWEGIAMSVRYSLAESTNPKSEKTTKA